MYQALIANADVAALVGDRVYDVPPREPQFPYVSFGPNSYQPERQDCFARRMEVFQIDCWTRDLERSQPLKAICDAVVGALDTVTLTLDEPYATGRVELILARTMDDPDGITRHGVLQFECEVTNG